MADHLTTIREAVAELLRHDEAAHAGPWVYFDKPKYGEHHVGIPAEPRPWNVALFPEGCPTGEADARAIAHFRTAAPACARVIDEWALAIDGTLKRYGDALPLQVKERLEELLADGVRTLDGLPAYRPLSPREQRLVQALEHYADEATWHDSDSGGDVYRNPEMPGWRVAADALQEVLP